METKTNEKNRNLVWGIISILSIIFIVWIFSKEKNNKPSVCDCNAVFQNQINSKEVYERILKTEIKYVVGSPKEQSQRRCRLKWEKEIKAKFGTAFIGNEAESFFLENCK